MLKVLPNEAAWAAVYTRSRYEKHLHQLLQEQQLESFLPLHRVERQWTDRKKWVDAPLFPSYLFVRVTEKERFRVLNTPGAVRYVTIGGKIARVREEEIDCIKRLTLTAGDTQLEAITAHIDKGTPVGITGGSLVGLRGELVSYQSSKRVMIRIESIGQNVLISVPLDVVEPLQVASTAR